MSHDNVTNSQILREVRALAGKVTGLDGKVTGLANTVTGLDGKVTSLTRTVDRIDQRLVDVEKHTSLIPGIAEAVMAHGIDLDDHEKRVKKLEQLAA
jgi:hypothetical protein